MGVSSCNIAATIAGTRCGTTISQSPVSFLQLLESIGRSQNCQVFSGGVSVGSLKLLFRSNGTDEFARCS